MKFWLGLHSALIYNICVHSPPKSNRNPPSTLLWQDLPHEVPDLSYEISMLIYGFGTIIRERTP